MYLRHTSGEATEVRNQQVLGDDSPLEFDEDGYAEVDDERGEMLLTMHRHLERGGRGPQTDDADETEAEDADEEAEKEEASWDQSDLPFEPDEVSVPELEERLSDGEFTTAELAALANAEEAGDDRTTALEAIESHRED